MFEWTLPENHAIAILKKDHDTVKDLFDKFEKTDNSPTRERIIGKALAALKAHAVIEEEIFYPAVRGKVGGKIMNEADEEHHVAKVLIAELEVKPKDDHRDGKFTVLAESVRHHIKEEENEMLPKAKDLDIDFEALGRAMLKRKHQLINEGFPPDAEHKMEENAKGSTDSPATAAHRRKSHAAAKGKSVAHRASTKGRPPAGH
jgi:hypothetical protein